LQLIDFYREAATSIRRDLEKQKRLLNMETISELCAAHQRQHRDLKTALTALEARKGKTGKKLIAGIQQYYPQGGWGVGNLDHLTFAQKCEAAGAAALGVNTEKNFCEGAPCMLTGITHLVKIPVIRWDFLLDAYQVLQTRLWGADAARIVVPMLDALELNDILQHAALHNIEIIAEVHADDDIERLLDNTGKVYPAVSGMLVNGNCVNDTAAAADLLKKIPADTPALFFSGQFSSDEIANLPADCVALFGKVMHESVPGTVFARF